jgi:glycosyltransferase involved in cell wall biosynthesis
MACGTPVIAFRRGSVVEVTEDDITGSIVDGEAQAIEAIQSLDRLDRRRVRQGFERRFTSRRIVDDYVRQYRRLRDGRARAIDDL